MHTLRILLENRDLEVTPDGISIGVAETSVVEALEHLQALTSGAPPSAIDIAERVKNKAKEKYDLLLTPDLLALGYSSGRLDVPCGLGAATRLVQGTAPGPRGTPVGSVTPAASP